LPGKINCVGGTVATAAADGAVLGCSDAVAGVDGAAEGAVLGGGWVAAAVDADGLELVLEQAASVIAIVAKATARLLGRIGGPPRR
jgi:hypothetical protein